MEERDKKIVSKLEKLVEESNVLQQSKQDSSDHRGATYRGWITSATAAVEEVSDYSVTTRVYHRHILNIAEESPNTALDIKVKSISQIIQRLLVDIENELIGKLK